MPEPDLFLSTSEVVRTGWLDVSAPTHPPPSTSDVRVMVPVFVGSGGSVPPREALAGFGPVQFQTDRHAERQGS